MTHDNVPESYLDLGRISHKDAAGRTKLEGLATNLLHQMEQAKWPRALQWFENLSYLAGNHLTRYYYTADGGFRAHTFGVNDKNPYDGMIAKVADNHLIRPVEHMTSTLTRMRPKPRVRPRSEALADQDAARISEIVLDLVWDRPLQMGAQIRQAGLIASIAGTAIAEVEYGPIDSPIVVPRWKWVDRPNPLAEGDKEEPTSIKVPVRNGTTVEFRKDIQVRMWSPFHITPDPAATTPQEMAWIARESYEDIEWIRQNFDKKEPGYYPENLENLKGQDKSHHVLWWWSRLQDVLDTPQYLQHGGGVAPSLHNRGGGAGDGQVRFTVIDVRPTKEHPQGRTLILASENLIYCGPARTFIPDEEGKGWKYPHRWHPYAFWGWFKLPGRFWHVPMLSQLVPLQKKINSIDALVHYNRQYLSVGQFLVPKHSKVPKGFFTGAPGAEIPYTDVPGMQKPERMKNEPLPKDLLEERMILSRAIDVISASGSVEEGVSPSANRAGVMLDFLKQEKLGSKSGMLQEFEQFIETIAQNILIEIQAGLTEQDEEIGRRVALATSEEGMEPVNGFVGSDLRDHHDVQIDIANELLKSPEAKEQKALDTLQYLGQTLNENERAGIFQALGLDEFIKNKMNASVKRAKRLIQRIVSKEFNAVFPMTGVEDPSVMVDVFSNEILSDRFLAYDEDVQSRLVEDLGRLQMEAQKQAEAQFQQQLARMAAIAQVQGKVEEGENQS